MEPTLWVSSELHHFYIELIAVILGAALAFYYILRSKVLEDKFSLFVGIGFFISVSIDLFHVIVSFMLVENISFIKYFIPQTWFAGRFFLGAMLLIAILKYSSSSQREEIGEPTSYESQSAATATVTATAASKQRDEDDEKGERKENEVAGKKDGIVLYITLLGIIAIVTALSSLFLIFPASVLDDYSLHRPYEVPPAILFCLVLFFFYKKKIYQKKDMVYKGLVLYLVIDIFTQIIMGFSATSFDTAHNIAHVLKDVGYFVNIIALIISSMQHSNNLKRNNVIIKENLKRIQETDKIKDDFINIAAHELRTPIQPILGLADLLDQNFQNNMKNVNLEEVKEDVKVIKRNAKKLQKLTNDLLDASRINSHILTLNLSKFDILELITNMVKDFNTDAEKKKNKISLICKLESESKDNNTLSSTTTTTPPPQIFVNGDRSRLTQVVSNLLNNAINFTKEGEITVIVMSKEKPNEIIVNVRDTGRGINPDITNHLFEKFISRSDGGTGLGLFISKSIVEAHGGKIWAENNENGIGSTFSFSIPGQSQYFD
ncbi:MAG TPA: ATP-binding protein [Candidatus Saccharimonadales bacterium]|nr:ATP-binding protein [Candidatus Saccharimonadales bacterium]